MKVTNVIICDDVRREHTGKHIIIGVYPDNILVPEFPATVMLCIWAQFLPDEIGEKSIEIRITQNKKELARGGGKIVIRDVDQSITGAISGLVMTIDDKGPLEFQYREGATRWRAMKRLGVGKLKS